MKRTIFTLIVLIFTFSLAFAQDKTETIQVKSDTLVHPPSPPPPPKVLESQERILEKHFLAEQLMSSIYIKDSATFKLTYFWPSKVKNIDKVFSAFEEISNEIDFTKGRKYGIDYEQNEFGEICCTSSYRQFRNSENERTFKIIFHSLRSQFTRMEECESIEIVNLQDPDFVQKIVLLER